MIYSIILPNIILYYTILYYIIVYYTWRDFGRGRFTHPNLVGYRLSPKPFTRKGAIWGGLGRALFGMEWGGHIQETTLYIVYNAS